MAVPKIAPPSTVTGAEKARKKHRTTIETANAKRKKAAKDAVDRHQKRRSAANMAVAATIGKK